MTGFALAPTPPPPTILSLTAYFARSSGDKFAPAPELTTIGPSILLTNTLVGSPCSTL